MSKYVKNLLSDHIRQRLEGVEDALLVDMIGLDAIVSNRLRSELEKKNIHVLVIKNSLGAAAASGTRLAPMFEGISGSAAVCWGGEDIVALAKEITRLAKDEKFAPFTARGGVMDGERLTAEQVEQVSKLPTRQGQLAILVGQILGPGARLAGQIMGIGGTLAGQIKSIADKDEGEAKEGEPMEPGPAGPGTAAAASEARA